MHKVIFPGYKRHHISCHPLTTHLYLPVRYALHDEGPGYGSKYRSSPPFAWLVYGYVNFFVDEERVSLGRAQYPSHHMVLLLLPGGALILCAHSVLKRSMNPSI